jgi:hypothetical protein
MKLLATNTGKYHIAKKITVLGCVIYTPKCSRPSQGTGRGTSMFNGFELEGEKHQVNCKRCIQSLEKEEAKRKKQAEMNALFGF